MNKFVLITNIAAFALTSGLASAATLKNLDKAEASVVVKSEGKRETIKLKENESFDSKGKDAHFIIAKEHPVAAKADEHFVIQGGKIAMEKAEVKTETKTEVKTETQNPAPVAVEPAAGKMESTVAPKVEKTTTTIEKTVKPAGESK